jgi:hemerythrin-like domain-containing protein
MSQQISILSLMIKDHRKLNDLIEKLDESTKKDFDSMKEVFTKFEWALEKHIFTEEKAIFTSYNPKNVSEGYKMLPELTKHHNYIVNKLNNWREDISKKRVLTDVYSFKEFLDNHRQFEEEKVYPKLDESLSEDDKRNIVAKINEMI